jgi:hypothetical protein
MTPQHTFVNPNHAKLDINISDHLNANDSYAASTEWNPSSLQLTLMFMFVCLPSNQCRRFTLMAFHETIEVPRMTERISDVRVHMGHSRYNAPSSLYCLSFLSPPVVISDRGVQGLKYCSPERVVEIKHQRLFSKELVQVRCAGTLYALVLGTHPESAMHNIFGCDHLSVQFHQLFTDSFQRRTRFAENFYRSEILEEIILR